MSTFTEKIKARRDEQQKTAIFSPEYKEAIWHLMIACGGVLSDQAVEELENENRYWNDKIVSYYSARPDIDTKKTIEIFPLISKHGIDYKASSDPAEHVGSGFNGTFASEQLTVNVLYGKLVLKNGVETWIATQIDSELGFGGLIRTLTLNLTFQEALENMEERLTVKHGYFEGSCEVPYF